MGTATTSTKTSRSRDGVVPEVPEGAPSDSPRFMKSSWYKDPVNKTLWRPLALLGYTLMYKGDQKPRSGKLPVYTIWAQHLYVFPRAVIPMLLQYVSMQYLGVTWPKWVAFAVYALSLVVFASFMLLHMGSMTQKYGTLDGQIQRDGIPDVRLTSTMVGLLLTVTVRPLLGVLVAYDPHELPRVSPWLPLHLFTYTVVLDFWFYIYHRAMHEVDFLWKFHKTHHMTKHPNPMLSAFGDPEQDLFDILVVPLMTYLVYPAHLDFFTWWICNVYTLYIEAAGHTGIRIVWPATTCYYPLVWFNMEHIIEDHDLHHRNGWRKSFNYGKQTRLWDTLFGTTRPGRTRVESVPENIQW